MKNRLLLAISLVLAVSWTAPPLVEAQSEEATTVEGSAQGAEGSGPAAHDDGYDEGRLLGADFAQHVRAVARTTIPRQRDPRVLALRAGDVSREAAEAAGVAFEQLGDASALRQRQVDVAARRAELVARLEQLARARTWATLAANRSFDVVREQVSPEPWSLLRLRAFQELARGLAAEVVTTERALALANAAVEYLAERARVVDELDVSQAQVQTSEIAEERARLERVTAATDAVAERAREAEERAREEREAARDTAERAVADRWEALAPRLQAIVQQRTAEQETIEDLTDRRAEFSAAQIEEGAALDAMLNDPERSGRIERADALIDGLIEQRAAVREAADARRRMMLQRARELEAARDALATAERKVETDELAVGSLPDELRAQLRDVAAEELRVAREEVELAALRYENAQRLWSLNESQIHFYARAIDQVVPNLSNARARELFAINGENLKEVRRNVGERLVGLRLSTLSLFNDDTRIEAEDGGLGRWVRPLAILLVVLLLARLIPKYRDTLVLQLVELRKHPRLRRYTPEILKLGEVLHEAIRPIARAGAATVARSVFARFPLPRMLATWWFWVAGYRVTLRIVETLFIPRSARRPVMIGEYPNEVRLGVDLFSMSEARGRLVVRSFRLIGIYIVVGRISLAAIRFLLGPGFVFFWAGWLINLALIVLIYALAWNWRRTIIDEFVARTDERARKFADWVKERQDRPYIVLVVVALVLFLLAKSVARTAALWASGKGPGRFIANFAMRKKLERVSETNGAEVEEKIPLPVAYQQAFKDHPLTNEPYRVSRPQPLLAVTRAFEAWGRDKGQGTIAVVGDAGSGKTTFAFEIETALGGGIEGAEGAVAAAEDAAAKAEETTLEGEPVEAEAEEGQEKAGAREAGFSVSRVMFESKLTTVEAVHEWVAKELALECAPERSAIVEAVEAIEPRAVIVDQCENLFLRRVGGFAAIDEFLDLCTLTNHRIFWVLVFDRYPWSYLHRVWDRRGYFREIVSLKPMGDEMLRQLIEARNETVGVHPSFDRLTGAEAQSDQSFELVRTDAGFYRLLAEYSRGNLRVALHTWLQSLHKDADGTVHVSLFSRPDGKLLKQMGDEQLFALTALVKHRTLTVDELAETLDARRPACEVMLNLLQETGFVDCSKDGRYYIATRSFLSVLARLRQENYLHLD